MEKFITYFAQVLSDVFPDLDRIPIIRKSDLSPHSVYSLEIEKNWVMFVYDDGSGDLDILCRIMNSDETFKRFIESETRGREIIIDSMTVVKDYVLTTNGNLSIFSVKSYNDRYTEDTSSTAEWSLEELAHDIKDQFIKIESSRS